MERNALLQQTQQRIQASMVELISRLLTDQASESVWEEDLARIRFESEESWQHCNAFLLAYTAARFSAHPTNPITDSADGLLDQFTVDFVAAVQSEDADRAIELWTDPPVLNPRAAAATKQTSMLTAVIQHLRSSAGSRTLPLPAAFPREVWLESIDLDNVDVIES
ncbi:hypothetical protein [Herbiconiux sp. VKM Ac-2851]|uniref:hypothetical protein n=1 Tax=Herbiconiux sp. VKM Ac-2851 TaxID=2739025 RepID=UPI001566C059|nr:hypothetical protein [Herbiconiux sp. VKM Ac-2851]NQX37050.1 hypothetical protein [Herbiconiux sp. VKM Ac-2851]